MDTQTTQPPPAGARPEGVADADGQRRFGTRLNQDAAFVGGVGVLHALVRRGGRGTIDHVVVGPAGVTVVEAKSWTGRMWAGRTVLGQGREMHEAPFERLREQLADVTAVLAAAGREDIAVAGAVCFVNDNDGLSRDTVVEVDGVPIGRCAPTIRRAMRDGDLDVLDVVRVLDVLQAAFPVHGETSEPRARRTTESAGEPTRAVTAASPPGREPDAPRAARTPAPPPARSVRRERLVEGAALLLLLALLALGLAVFGPSGSLSRERLDAKGPALRARAARLAGRDVAPPKVLSRGDEFVLTYRGGPGCLVRFRVRRTYGTEALDNPASRVRGCRS